MGTVTIVTRDGKRYTNPKDVHYERNEITETFYQLVLDFVPPEKKEDKKVDTA